MKAVFISFKLMITQVKNDIILFAVCFVPLLCGSIFKFVIPIIEKQLVSHFNTSVISPYYIIFDLFLSVITPTMFCFIAAMVILEEKDEKTADYCFITPLGKYGYLFSKLGIPAVISFIANIIITAVFKLTDMNFLIILLTSLNGCLTGLLIALTVISFSNNKLEGMAVTKIASLLIIGLPAPFFISGNFKYILSVLPTFWAGEAFIGGKHYMLLFSLILSLIWCYLISYKFNKKLMR